MLDPVPKWLWIIPLMLFAMMATASVESRTKDKCMQSAPTILEGCFQYDTVQAPTARLPWAPHRLIWTTAVESAPRSDDLIQAVRLDISLETHESRKICSPVPLLRPEPFAEPGDSTIRDCLIAAPSGREKLFTVISSAASGHNL